jgi:hypothetical protein
MKNFFSELQFYVTKKNYECEFKCMKIDIIEIFDLEIRFCSFLLATSVICIDNLDM